MIRLRMLPAQDGDCLLLEYGDGDFVRRILFDGGRRGTYRRIRPLLAGLDGPVDVLVVTHVDQDHILGVLALLDDPERPVEIGDVWFNGFDHLHDREVFGAVDGELLTSALLAQGLSWNAAFDGRSIEVGRRPDWFDDGSTMTVLAPDRGLLESLIGEWAAKCAEAGLMPGVDPVEREPVPGIERFGAIDVDALAGTPFVPDGSPTNPTSIGLLFEFEGTRIVFTGDADDGRLVDSIRPLAEAEGGRLRIDALKVAHHGSKKNISNDLLDLLDCGRYLISTNGKVHGHPDDVAIARILAHGGPAKDLVFNYRDRAAVWDVPELRERFGYRVLAPAPAGDDGFVTLDFGPP
ncbi:ComEC/Rec2 family competence protein [Streptomyces sp. NPDC012888]|uniref:ComEC/Rec2 family competence protein n=1 Tax=Streptomyces sp. NPDC012888 TaxID=3364855 RepID=UPI0036CFFC76